MDNEQNVLHVTEEMHTIEDFMDTGVVEEVVDNDQGVYDSAINNQYEQNLLFQLYQPEESHDSLICRICQQLGKDIRFDDRQQYATHRYKVHGSYNNGIVCPLLTCKESYASLTVLRKHLMIDHKLGLEIHYQVFANMGEFERWRHLVELTSHSRFMMHTKQPSNKRQVMHCSRSEHKMVLQSKRHKLPRLRMQKEGSCCPAMLSFRVDERSGQVFTHYQLVHIGHAAAPESVEKSENDSGSVFTMDATGTGRLPSLHFPEKPIHMGERAMQYLQIDLMSLPDNDAIYNGIVYSNVLMVTDLYTGFLFAKPIGHDVTKDTILRIVNDIFCQYGVPEGFCCSVSHCVHLMRDVMATLANVFNISIKEIFNEMPDYDSYRKSLLFEAETNLKSRRRWVEVVPFFAMGINQGGQRSPFERMFKRKPYSTMPPPWSHDYSSIHGDDDNSDDEHVTVSARYQIGDRVYLRNVDSRPGRGNVVPYLYGFIGDVDWEHSPSFPYRVHYSKSSEPWPTEKFIFTWASCYDVLPTTHDLMMIRDEDRRRVMSTLLCTCQESDSTDEDGSCTLFRSHWCSNRMALKCCRLSGKDCAYHEHITGDESYLKIELLSTQFAKDANEADRKRVDKQKSHYQRPQDLPIDRMRTPSEEFEMMEELSPSIIDVGRNETVQSIRSPASTPSILRSRRMNRTTKGASNFVVLGSSTSNNSQQIVTNTHSESISSSLKRNQPRGLVRNKKTRFDSLSGIDTAKEEIADEDPSVIQAEVEVATQPMKSPEQEHAVTPSRRSSRAVKAKVYSDFVT